jgi:exosortase
MAKETGNGILEEFRIDFVECWQRLPNKGFFFILLAAWFALFQFLGNSTMGYLPTPSLLQWMYIVYRAKADPEASDEAHGLLVPFLVLGLFWWRRKELLALQVQLWWPALLLIGFALGLHVLGYIVQQPRISIVALFTGIYGIMGLAWGRQWLRASIFPFFLFGFCVPLGWSAQAITFPLRLWVCKLAVWISNNILQFDDTRREGTRLFNPVMHYQYDVAPACSGIRSLFSISAVTIIYAFLSFRTWWKRGLLIASAVPLAVLGNVVRLLTIVVAAELWGQDWGERAHEGGPLGIISLLPYAGAFGGMLLLGYVLHEKPSKPPAPQEAEAK